MTAVQTPAVSTRLLPAILAAGISALGLVGCGGLEIEPLPPVEIFRWSEQPISFSPPPETWTPLKAQSGGLNGVRFERYGRPWGRIVVAEYYPVGRRDRRAAIAELIRDIDVLSDSEFRNQLLRSQLVVKDPVCDEEREIARLVNNALRQAGEDHRKADLILARQSLEAAMAHANQLEFVLDHFIDDVVVTADRFVDSDSVSVAAPRPDTLGGVPVQIVEYTMRHHEHVYSGREIWALVDNHLFTFDCLGTEEDMRLFERVVATVSFPPLEIPE